MCVKHFQTVNVYRLNIFDYIYCFRTLLTTKILSILIYLDRLEKKRVYMYCVLKKSQPLKKLQQIILFNVSNNNKQYLKFEPS